MLLYFDAIRADVKANTEGGKERRWGGEAFDILVGNGRRFTEVAIQGVLAADRDATLVVGGWQMMTSMTALSISTCTGSELRKVNFSCTADDEINRGLNFVEGCASRINLADPS